jgi:hypothetical protein
MTQDGNKEPCVKSGLQRMMNSAVEYFLAGERCSLEMKYDPYRAHKIGTPTTVLYAFSVEMILKVLLGNIKLAKKNDVSQDETITLEDVVKKKVGHSLKKLFNLLPNDSKQRLAVLEDENTCIIDIDENNNLVTTSILSQIDTSFVDWRYHFEKRFLTIDDSYLTTAFMRIHDEIRNLFPDFMSNTEKVWGKFEMFYENIHSDIGIASSITSNRKITIEIPFSSVGPK